MAKPLKIFKISILMANLQEILRIESENSDKIHFYREGVFYKAYEQSAYLFVTHVKPFMVKKQFVKSVNREVVSIGFPTNSIHNPLAELIQYAFKMG